MKQLQTQLCKDGYSLTRLSSYRSILTHSIPSSRSLATESKTVKIDFANPGASAYDDLKSAVNSLDGPVGVLVNNVGVSHSMPVDFHECPESEMENVVEINVLATMRVTKIVLPNMLSK